MNEQTKNGVDEGAPYLDKACGETIVSAPDSSSSFGVLLSPHRDAEEVKSAVAFFAKRAGRDAAWIESKLRELGVD
jgi:hypothetical protein